jgi:hypothetical protein
MPPAGPPLPILIDEEISPVYDTKHFYPAKPGEILTNRYQPQLRLTGVCLQQYGSRVICKGMPSIMIIIFEALPFSDKSF